MKNHWLKFSDIYIRSVTLEDPKHQLLMFCKKAEDSISGQFDFGENIVLHYTYMNQIRDLLARDIKLK